MNQDFSEKILQWYFENARTLPWRSQPGLNTGHDPYFVWISEVMLQQTTVSTVIPYFEKFIQRFKSIHDLARASLEEILSYWQGMGYYTRARCLHRCAEKIFLHGLPETVLGWEKMPGIGPYTARSICAIAFNQRVVPIDGNIRRVFSRYLCLKDTSDRLIEGQIEPFWPQKHCGDFVQALMDLGAQICRPHQPKCNVCPLRMQCKSLQENVINDYPIKSPKPPKTIRHQHVWIIENLQNQWWIVCQTQKRLLRGLYTFPIKDKAPNDQKALFLGKIRHLFTHIDLHVEVWKIYAQGVDESEFASGHWVDKMQLDQWPFSKLMHKVATLALGHRMVAIPVNHSLL